jgi:hypothetical protein
MKTNASKQVSCFASKDCQARLQQAITPIIWWELPLLFIIVWFYHTKLSKSTPLKHFSQSSISHVIRWCHLRLIPTPCDHPRSLLPCRARPPPAHTRLEAWIPPPPPRFPTVASSPPTAPTLPVSKLPLTRASPPPQTPTNTIMWSITYLLHVKPWH